MTNLAYTSHLPEWERPALFGQYENVSYLFIYRRGFKVCLCQAIVFLPMLHYEYFMLPLHFRS